MTASNPPITPDELATLARLTTELIEAQVAYDAWALDADDRSVDAVAAMQDAREAFDAYITPERIARLVEAASAGAKDTARLDHLEAFCYEMHVYHNRPGEPMPNVSWRESESGITAQTTGATWREAIDASLASPTSTETATE